MAGCILEAGTAHDVQTRRRAHSPRWDAQPMLEGQTTSTSVRPGMAALRQPDFGYYRDLASRP